MHKLFLPSVRVQPSAVHPVQGRLGTLQDQNTARQTEMLQVHIMDLSIILQSTII